MPVDTQALLVRCSYPFCKGDHFHDFHHAQVSQPETVSSLQKKASCFIA